MTPDELADRLEGRTYWAFRADRVRENKSVLKSRAECERILTHQFTIEGADSSEILCLRSDVISASFLFVFSNGRLSTIRQSAGMLGADAPEGMARSILAADAVEPPQIAGIIQRETEREPVSEPPPIPTVLWHLTDEPMLREEAELLEALDGSQLHLNMAQADVLALLGEPTSRCEESAAHVILIYDAQPKRSGMRIRLSVVLRDEHVEAVYTQQFWFDDGR